MCYSKYDTVSCYVSNLSCIPESESDIGISTSDASYVDLIETFARSYSSDNSPPVYGYGDNFVSITGAPFVDNEDVQIFTD